MMSQLMRTMCEGGRRVLDDMTDLVRGRMVEVKVNFILELKEMLVLSLRSVVKMKVMTVFTRLWLLM